MFYVRACVRVPEWTCECVLCTCARVGDRAMYYCGEYALCTKCCFVYLPY